MVPSATQLRSRCQVLEFDDQKAGGSTGVSASAGKPYLRMSQHTYSSPNKKTTGSSERSWYLPLDAIVSDKLPGLPSSSAPPSVGADSAVFSERPSWAAI